MRSRTEIFLKQTPALKLLLGLVSGILLQEYIVFSLMQIVVGSCISAAMFIVYSSLSLKYKFQMRWLGGISMFLIALSLGAFLLHKQHAGYSEETLQEIRQADAVELIIHEPLEAKLKTYKALSKIRSIKAGDQWEPAFGNVLIYFSKDSLPVNIGMGTHLIVRKPLQLIENAGNPGEFDYRTYSRRNGIYFRTFLKADEYRALAEKTVLPGSYVFALRDRIIGIIDKHIHSDKARAVAKALLIGYRKDIDRDLLAAFTNTGVVHIIAISGMHLAMIFVAMQYLLTPFRKRRHGKAVSAAVTLAVVWLFTFLAGAVPSITRAAVMITCIIIGSMIGRKTNIYNSLAVSAFVLLLADPYDLWDVGFLLSYTAVLSIVLFQQKIYRSLYFQNKIMLGIWNVVSVTLAAQILTLPLILYYFHRFPNLFIVSNLFAVPLSAVILYLLAAMVILSGVPLLGNLLGVAAEKLIILFNGMLQYLNEVPFNITDNIRINFMQAILLFALNLLLREVIHTKKRNYLYASLMAFAAIVSIGIHESRKHSDQLKLAVYNTPGNIVIDFMEGKKSFVVAKEPVARNSSTDTYVLKPAAAYFHTKPADSLASVHLSFPEIKFHQYHLFVLNAQASLPPIPSTGIRLVLVADNRREDLSRLKELFPNAAYVFTNTNSLWKIRQWKKECNALNLRCHSTALDGAFITEVN